MILHLLQNFKPTGKFDDESEAIYLKIMGPSVSERRVKLDSAMWKSKSWDSKNQHAL
jgi:hypothetical protein